MRSPIEPVAYHLVMRLSDGRPIATTPQHRRVVARVVLEQGEHRGVLGFGLGPDHLHIEAAAPRKVIGELARYVATALRQRLRLTTPFGRTWIEHTRDQRHLRNRLLYVMGQDRHHGGGRDPFFEGTSLPDLLGLRVVDSTLVRRVRAQVPNLAHRDLIQLMPLQRTDQHDAQHIEHLAEASAAAFALPSLRGRAPEVVLARHAAVLAVDSRTPSRELSTKLGIGQRAIQRLRSSPCDERFVRAVRAQLWLRRATAPHAAAADVDTIGGFEGEEVLHAGWIAGRRSSELSSAIKGQARSNAEG